MEFSVYFLILQARLFLFCSADLLQYTAYVPDTVNDQHSGTERVSLARLLHCEMGDIVYAAFFSGTTVDR